MEVNDSGRRDKRGRFGPGNKAGSKAYRHNQFSTQELVNLVDQKLICNGESRNVNDLVAESACQLLLAAANGDRKAATWVLERFYPIESERHFLTEILPSPSDKPLDYLNALASAVSASELTTNQAVRLSQLTKPFLVDTELNRLQEVALILEEKIYEIERKMTNERNDNTH